DRLVHAELLFRRGLPPRVRYVFKHALLQDAAYTSLLKSDRKRHHQRIAEALEGSFPEVAAAQPELVAHHFTEAGLPERALPFWRRAGENAFQSSAFLEAAGHLERALGLLAELPESKARDEQEIGLQLAFGLAKGAGLTPAVPEARNAYARALELCQREGDHPQLFQVLRGLTSDHVISGQPRQALETASRLMEMAERAGSPTLRMHAFESMSFVLLNLGDIVAAHSHLEHLIALGSSQTSTGERSRHRLLEPLLGGLAQSSWILWFLGYPGQAVERSREALEKVRQSSASFTVGFVKCFSADLHLFRREAGEASPLARELVDLSAEHRLRPFSIIGDFQLGCVAAEQGDAAAGIETMRRALDARLAAGTVAGSVIHFSFLAAHLLEAGRCEEGLATVERALGISADGGHGLMDAELCRLKGELLLRRGEADEEADSHLQRALDIARRQSTRSLELRAAMSLARRWHELG